MDAFVLGRAFVNLTAPDMRPIRVSFEATEKVLALSNAKPGFSFDVIVHDLEMDARSGECSPMKSVTLLLRPLLITTRPGLMQNSRDINTKHEAS